MGLDRADRWLLRQAKRAQIDARKSARTAQQKRGVKYVRMLRGNQTKAERLLRAALIDAGYWFKAQSMFFSPTHLYIPDFLLKLNGQRLVIEVDGPSHVARKGYDAQRTEWMRSHRQCVVIRFTNEQIYSELPLVMQTIAAFEPKLRSNRYKYTVHTDKGLDNSDPAVQFKQAMANY